MSKRFLAALCGLGLALAAGSASAMDLYSRGADQTRIFLLDKDSFRREGAIVTASMIDLFANVTQGQQDGKPVALHHMVFTLQFDCQARKIRNGGADFVDPDGKVFRHDEGSDEWEPFDERWLSFVCEGSPAPTGERYASIADAERGYAAWRAAN